MSELTHTKSLNISDLSDIVTRSNNTPLSGNNAAGIGYYYLNKGSLAYKIDEYSTIALGTLNFATNPVFGIVIDETKIDSFARYLWIANLKMSITLKSNLNTSRNITFAVCKLNSSYNANTSTSVYLSKYITLATLNDKSISSTGTTLWGSCTNVIINLKTKSVISGKVTLS